MITWSRFLKTTSRCCDAQLRLRSKRGQFRKDLDLDQWVFDFTSITTASHHQGRLMGDPQTEAKAFKAFESLLNRSK